MARLLIEHKKIDSGSVELGFTSADLRDASCTTAQVTGAFALMDCDEVKKYASVYGHQLGQSLAAMRYYREMPK